MITRLTDLQLAALSGAATRDDKCVQLPATLRGAQLRKTDEKLMELGYVREVKGKPTSPISRRDDATGAYFALKLTTAAAKAVKEGEKAGAASRASEQAPSQNRLAAPSPAAAHPVKAPDPQPKMNTSPLSAERKAPSGAPRPGSKIAEVIVMLERESGVTIPELIAATGWLSHKTRAAFTGLRKRGYKIVSDRSDREHGSVYRIEAGSAASVSELAQSVAEAP